MSSCQIIEKNNVSKNKFLTVFCGKEEYNDYVDKNVEDMYEAYTNVLILFSPQPELIYHPMRLV